MISSTLIDAKYLFPSAISKRPTFKLVFFYHKETFARCGFSFYHPLILADRENAIPSYDRFLNYTVCRYMVQKHHAM